MKPSSFSFVIRLLRQWAIKFLMASILRIVPTSVGLLCWMDTQAQQMPQDYWVYEETKTNGLFFSLAIGPDQLIYTGSNDGTSVSVFDKSFVRLRQFGSFSAIRGIAINSQTNVIVLDAGQSKIKIFDAQGAFLREFGGTGIGDGQFRFTEPSSGFFPGGGVDDNGRPLYTSLSYNCGTMIALDRQDRLYVTDTANQRVQVFDSQGGFLRKWGGTGGLPESLLFPRSILVLPSDRVLVWGASRDCCNGFGELGGNIKVFDLNGNYLSTVSGSSYGNNMALTPDGLAAIDMDRYNYSNPRIGVNASGNLVGIVVSGIIGYGSSGYKGFAFDNSGDIYFIVAAWGSNPGGIYVMRRKFRVDNPLFRNRIPQPSVIRAVQRPGTTLIDIDYRVVDADSPTVQVAMSAFVDGGNSLGSLVKMSTFAEGTQANLGANLPANTDRRVTWNVGTDWPVGFVNLQFEILAKDERGLLPFHFITVPASGGNPALTLSHQQVLDDDLLSLWYWLIANGDSAVNLINGQVKGVGGTYNGQVLASGSSTTAAGRNFLFQRLNLRTPTSAEITRAQSGRYGFATVSANSVVKLP